MIKWILVLLLFAADAHALNVDSMLSMNGTKGPYQAINGLNIASDVGWVGRTDVLNLAVGESRTINIASIWTFEKRIKPDDTQAKISTLSMWVGGADREDFIVQTVGKIKNDMHFGELIVENPLRATSNGMYAVMVYGGIFNAGLNSLCAGPTCGALNLRASIERLPAPVPLPAAVWLFASAIAGIGFVARRKA